MKMLDTISGMKLTLPRILNLRDHDAEKFTSPKGSDLKSSLLKKAAWRTKLFLGRQIKMVSLKMLDTFFGGGRINPSWQIPRFGLAAGIPKAQWRLLCDAFFIANLSLYICGLDLGAARLAGDLWDRSANQIQPVFVFSRAETELNNSTQRRFAMNECIRQSPVPIHSSKGPVQGNLIEFSDFQKVPIASPEGIPDREGDFCFLMVIGTYQAVHGLSEETAKGMSRLYYNLRESLIEKGV